MPEQPRSSTNNSNDSGQGNQRIALERYFCEVVFNYKSEEGKKLHAICKKFINNYSINSVVDAEDILSEAYSRCLAKVSRGSIILNHYSYVKQVTINCIRESARKNPKPESIEIESLESFEDPVLDLYYQQIQNRLNTLEPLENRLICLRELERIPYDEIVKILEDEGFQHYTPANLRQMRRRIMMNLKKDLGDEGYTP